MADATAGSAAPAAGWRRFIPTKISKIPRPSRGMVIFGSIVGTYALLIYRDRHLTAEVRRELEGEAKYLASQPQDPRERVRKVAVFLQRPAPDESIRATREYFRKYIKPVLDAAAVDYDLVEAFEPGVIARHTCGTLVKKQAYLAWTADDALRAHVLTTAADDVKFKFRMHDYDGYLAVGRKPFEEVLIGYDSALRQIEQERDAEHATKLAEYHRARTTAESSWFAASPPPPPVRERRLALPPVAYLPVDWMTGMRTWPFRIYRWFNDWERFRDAGRATLAIARRGPLRELEPTDLALGIDEWSVHRAAVDNGVPEGVADEPVLVPEYEEMWPAPKPKENPAEKAAAEMAAASAAAAAAAAAGPAPTVADLFAVPGALRDVTQQIDAPATPEFAAESAEPAVPELSDAERKAQEKAAKEAEKQKKEEEAKAKEELAKRKAQLWRQYFVPKRVNVPAVLAAHVEIYDTAKSREMVPLAPVEVSDEETFVQQ
ncbi:mitochondrial import inner membrane translocase subunit tim54 [Allomyces arbusculus]|nr:mitochondrial import inner membrane translocase subunit tim54 [Allomyces arbusculus]